MFKIVRKKQLNEQVVLLELEAPFIAAKAEAGQFIIFRLDENGERVPLTISDYDREKGTITIVFQTVGSSTTALGKMNEGDSISDVVGPLGTATEYGDNIKKVAVVGGGVGCAIAYPQAKKLFGMGAEVGCAIAYPQAKKLFGMGAEVDLIAGFRSKDIVILEDEMKKVTSNLYICTDDGSYGTKGFVTDKLKELIEAGNNYDEVIAIGPVIMMKFISKLTEAYGIKTIVSLNPIMIDGTGMCGGCRVTVDGKIKYACVDGPDFDGHKVDFDELMKRNSAYREIESEHICRLTGGKRHG